MQAKEERGGGEEESPAYGSSYLLSLSWQLLTQSDPSLPLLPASQPF